MQVREDSFCDIVKYSKELKGAVNFIDLLLMKTEDELREYRYYSVGGSIMVISPDKTLSIYAKNQKQRLWVLEGGGKSFECC